MKELSFTKNAIVIDSHVSGRLIIKLSGEYMPKDEKERIKEQASKHDTLEERMQKTRNEIMETYRKRMKSEKDFLEVIKKQKKYWEDQLENTDPQKNKERYAELEEKIENEKTLIKQIKEELNNLDKELGKEKEHEEMERK